MTEPRHALITTFGDPFTGCEAATIELQARSTAHLMELEASGRLSHVHAWITLTGNRSRLSSMQVVEGDREQIKELFWSKQWKTDMVHARPLLQEVCIEFAIGGSPASLAGPLSVYGEAAASVTR